VQYKFTRYFAPIDRNRPSSAEDLYASYDLGLFDLKPDPAEMTNLAARKGEHAALVITMSNKPAAQIEAEIGSDGGREMPEVEGMNWNVDSLDL